jgi:hypothetical protein
MADEARFWGAVALVAIAAVISFKALAGSKVGARFPGLQELGAFI